jgi:hypothetical protein
MAAALSYQSLFSTLRYESTKAVVGFFVAYVDDVFEDKAQELSRAMMARPGPQRSLVLTEDRQVSSSPLSILKSEPARLS